jgi:hypothetical protein
LISSEQLGASWPPTPWTQVWKITVSGFMYPDPEVGIVTSVLQEDFAVYNHRVEMDRTATGLEYPRMRTTTSATARNAMAARAFRPRHR